MRSLGMNCLSMDSDAQAPGHKARALRATFFGHQAGSEPNQSANRGALTAKNDTLDAWREHEGTSTLWPRLFSVNSFDGSLPQSSAVFGDVSSNKIIELCQVHRDVSEPLPNLGISSRQDSQRAIPVTLLVHSAVEVKTLARDYLVAPILSNLTREVDVL